MSYNPKVVPFNRSSAYVHHRAMINRRENNPVDALELMRHAVERSPENREYRLDLAELYCEMGCHEQSNRLLLDMLAQKDAPAECYYGLALNQLGMNDLAGARHSLQLYRRADPHGAHTGEVRRLASELELFDTMNRPVSRKLYRAMRVADRACHALQEGDCQRARQLFEHSLALSSEQYEMRAMYAMTLMMCGDDVGARREANRAAEGFPPSLRALCVASQVFSALGDRERAAGLLRKVMGEHPSGVELRLLIYALSEVGMHEEIAECTRLALQETPYDRHLLHIRATALHHLGLPDGQIARFWQRILRIDPDDSVARFYQEACARGDLNENAPGYVYQVPEAECQRRTLWLSEQMQGGLTGIQTRWKENPAFRQTILWAAQSDDEKLRRAAVTVIAALEDEQAQSSIRSLIFNRELQMDLRLHAASLLKLRGADMNAVFPTERSFNGAILPDAEELMDGLMVGERQRIRCAGAVLEEEYGMSETSSLTLMWTLYRRNRGMRFDPLINAEAAAAALVYNFLLLRGQQPSFDALISIFGCSRRKLIYYAGHMAEILERLEGDTHDENS